MPTTFQLDPGAVDYLNWLGSAISECEMPGSLRVRVAASCLAIAQDHHHAIVALLDHKIYSSSFALLRCQFEAYVRGEWLCLCATDAEVSDFADGGQPPFIREMIAALEATPAFSENILSRIKTKSWDAMCSFTHTGGLHIQRWGTGSIIEPSYADEEVRGALAMAEVFGALAVVGVAYLASDEKTAERVLTKVRERTGE